MSTGGEGERVAVDAGSDGPGTYAGLATRVTAYILDLTIVFVSFTIGAAVTDYVIVLVFGEHGQATAGVRALVAGAYTAYLVLYFWIPVAVFGRTAGHALFGLRVRRGDGSKVPVWRALVRAVCLPFLTTVTLGLSALGIQFGRRRRALHDVVAGTVVVYDRVELPTPELHVTHAQRSTLSLDLTTPAAPAADAR